MAYIDPSDPQPYLDNLDTPKEQGPDIYEQAVTLNDQSSPKLTLGETQVIKRRLSLAKEYSRKEFADDAKQSLRLWKGQHERLPSQQRSDPLMTVNYTLPTVETKVAHTAWGYPDFYAEALTPDAVEPSKVALAALKYWWQEIGIQEKSQYCVWDKEVYSFGIMYVGWLITTTEFQSITGFDTESGDPSLTQGTDPISDPVIEQANIIQNRPYVCRIDPRQWFIDPQCGRDIDDSKYCGYWEIWSLEDLKHDKRFKNTKQIKGSSKGLKEYLDPSYHSKLEEELPNDVKTVKVYHYFEKKRRLHVCMCDDHDKALLEERWDWVYDRYPFRVLHGPCAPSDWYGVSTPSLIEDPQMEINETRSQLSKHRRRANRKLWTTAGNLNPYAEKALRSAEDLAVIYTSTPAPINVIPPITIQEEVYRADGLAKTDINSMTGVSSYETATQPTFRKTNDEANFIAAGGSARTQADAVAYERFLEGIARDIIDLLMQYPTQTRQLPIYDQGTNAQTWVNFDRSYIQGDYNLRIYAGSTQPDNNSDKVKNISFLLQSLAPFMGLNGAPALVDPKPLLSQLLQAVPYIKNANQILAAPPPPQPMGGQPGAPGQPPPGNPVASQPGPGSIGPGNPPGPPSAPVGPPGPGGPPELGQIMQILSALPPQVIHIVLQQLVAALQQPQAAPQPGEEQPPFS